MLKLFTSFMNEKILKDFSFKLNITLVREVFTFTIVLFAFFYVVIYTTLAPFTNYMQCDYISFYHVVVTVINGFFYFPFFFIFHFFPTLLHFLFNVISLILPLQSIIGVTFFSILKDVDFFIINIFHIFKIFVKSISNNNVFEWFLHLYEVIKFDNTLNLPLFFFSYVLFILTTIFSFFYLSFFGFYGVFVINLISLILFWFTAVLSFNDFFINNVVVSASLGKWFIFDLNHTISFDLLIDSISYSFFFLTLTISVFVYMFAFSYFRYEPNVERFILLLNSFVISMICLVLSGNCFVLFLGWELIGLTSFFLINFWSTKISVLKSAFKAFSFNKLSDVSLFIFLFIVLFCFDDTNIMVINDKWSSLCSYNININNVKIASINICSFFLLISVCIKSAQFGFHLWLPDSMEAPVPASALIHSATLVSAGIFLLLRFTNLFELSFYGSYLIPLIGSFTAFYGGLGSVYQSDSKRILAYSTISHCGFLMVCYSTFIPEYTILYLYVHGFFKAAIFLCLGNVIRFFRNVQDIRRMGNVWKYLPFECFASFVCLINLSGLPFTLGFYIKHLLLLGLHNDIVYLFFVLVNLLGGAVFGVIYSFRFFYYIFFDFKKSKKVVYNDANRVNLKSFFYTNSGLMSSLVISCFIAVSYTIIIYLYFIFLNKNSLGDGFNSFSINISKYEEFAYMIPSFANNIGYFNWFLLILILLLLIVNWRVIFFNYQINFFFFLNFVLYFVLFLKL